MCFDDNVEVPGRKFTSPVRPDAVLIHGSKWLVIEAKHIFTNPLLNTFKAKCDFISNNADKVWVHRKFPVPTEIKFMACSIGSFPRATQGSNTSDIIKVVRDGLAYTIVAA